MRLGLKRRNQVFFKSPRLCQNKKMAIGDTMRRGEGDAAEEVVEDIKDMVGMSSERLNTFCAAGKGAMSKFSN